MSSDTRPRPLRTIAIGVGGAGALLASLIADLGELAVALGMRPDLADPLERVVFGLLALTVAFVTGRLGEHDVTPLANPRDAEGRQLVPAGELDDGDVTASVRPPDATGLEDAQLDAPP